jgi:hypothetical protein
MVARLQLTPVLVVVADLDVISVSPGILRAPLTVDE